MMKRHILDRRGFTLIELLIVMGMLTLVLVAVLSLYDTHSKSAYVQEEVVDVQQNLRIAMDSISRDIKMAGVLIPLDDNAGTGTNVENVPVGFVGNNSGVDAGFGVTDTMTLNAASAAGQYGRIDVDYPVMGTTVTLKLDSSDAVTTFSIGNTVRIVRPPERTDPAGPNGTIFQVTGFNSDPNVRTITLTRVKDDDPTGKTFNKGDMVTGTDLNAAYPNSIRYFVTSGGNCPTNMFCLARATNEGTAPDTQVIATNITNLQFRYILDTNTETDAPVDYKQIRAVRVTITGQTVATRVQSGGPKTKQITSIVKLRNR